MSFETMRARRIRQVLALDEQFELAGFELVSQRARGVALQRRDRITGYPPRRQQA